MRKILVETARRKGRTKHGGELIREELDNIPIVISDVHEDLLALDAALDRLKVENKQAFELVQLRYFAGLSLIVSADLLDLSPRTAGRLCAYALDIDDPTARKLFLMSGCEQDRLLLNRVEALLASHDGQSQFLNTPVVDQIADNPVATMNADFRVHYVDDNFCVKSSIIPAFLRFVRQFCHPAIDAPSVAFRFQLQGWIVRRWRVVSDECRHSARHGDFAAICARVLELCLRPLDQPVAETRGSRRSHRDSLRRRLCDRFSRGIRRPTMFSNFEGTVCQVWLGTAP